MRRARWAIVIGAGVLALAHAISKIWLCDDAFISFRYADHLAHGHGLVFNLGERVEGDTNFLWTVWIAVGRLFGASAPVWAVVWGLVCYAAAFALVTRRSLQIADLPTASLFAAAHVAWAEFATSGLETSAYTLLAFAGYVLVCPESDVVPSRRRIAAAGAVFALAALTRPDGVLFGVVAGGWLLAQRRVRDGLVLAAAFAIVWIPPTIWRISYYGDFFPNTYYAKSAGIPWWSQGARYALWYLERYMPFVLVPFALVAAGTRRRAALELAIVVVFTVYVMRVGGDFMFARMLVPLTPFLALLLQRALLVCRPRMWVVMTVASTLAIWRLPMWTHDNLYGVVDERHWYQVRPWAVDSDRDGAALERMLQGLPVVIAFEGAGARRMYRSDVPTAIECATGLTDAYIAHLPLKRRGRVGHEKHVPPEYLLARGVDFATAPTLVPRADEVLPHLLISLGGARMFVYAWHPAIMDAVLARGATFPDLPWQLKRELDRWPTQNATLVAREMDLFLRALQRLPGAGSTDLYRLPLQSLPSADGGERSRPR